MACMVWDMLWNDDSRVIKFKISAGKVSQPVISRALHSTTKQLNIDTKTNKKNLTTMSLFTCDDDSSRQI